MAGTHNINHPIKAVCWMALGLMSFIALAVSVRQLSSDYSTYQILGVRSVIGLIILSLIIARQNRRWYVTLSPNKQIIRNIIHFIGQYLWVLGVTLLPLAQVFALEFTTPAWGALLACVFLKEKLTRARAIALACGFVGLVMIVKPDMQIFQSASMLVIISAFFFALSLLFVKQLSQYDNVATILFYFCLIQLPLGLIPAAFNWVPITFDSSGWFVLVGLCGLSAHLGITKAIQHADLLFIQPIDFLRVPLVALVGFYLYAEPIDLWLLIGALIIFSGNFYSLTDETKKHG